MSPVLFVTYIILSESKSIPLLYMSIDLGQWRAAIGEFNNSSAYNPNKTSLRSNIFSEQFYQLRFLPLTFLTILIIVLTSPIIILVCSCYNSLPFSKLSSTRHAVLDHPFLCIKSVFFMVHLSIFFMFRVSCFYIGNLTLIIKSIRWVCLRYLFAINLYIYFLLHAKLLLQCGDIEINPGRESPKTCLFAIGI